MKRRSGGGGRHDLAQVHAPIAGYPSMPTSVNNRRGQILPVAIADPYEAGHRVRALARIDLLDRERRTGKIDEAQYLVGREIERVFEDMNRSGGGGQWWDGTRVDAASAAELRVMLGFERAFAVNSFLGWIVRRVGHHDTQLLWQVLGNRISIATAALIIFGRSGVRGYRYGHDRLCDALGVLADAKAARGRALRRAAR